MAEVKVLIKGIHEKREGKMRVGSTACLVKTDKNIVVDTGSFLDKDRLIEALKNENLTPEQIDIVILTHRDLDHTVNVNLFKNAKVFAKFRGEPYPGQVHFVKEGTIQRFELRDGTEIAKDVSILLTPGHCPDMISVVVNTDKGKVVIASDAIGVEAFLDENKEPDPVFHDIPKYNESRKKILQIADYVILGHGGMIKVEK